MKNISKSFYLQDGGKNPLAYIWNKITLLSLYVYFVALLSFLFMFLAVAIC